MVTALPLLILYVRIHSNSSQKIFLRVPNFHQQIPSTKYLLAISRFSAVPVGTENKETLSWGGEYVLWPSPLRADCVGGSELLRETIGSEVIRVLATSAPFLSFFGRLQAFQSKVSHSKIIPV